MLCTRLHIETNPRWFCLSTAIRIMTLSTSGSVIDEWWPGNRCFVRYPDNLVLEFVPVKLLAITELILRYICARGMLKDCPCKCYAAYI